jgi:hypothetical protein
MTYTAFQIRSDDSAGAEDEKQTFKFVVACNLPYLPGFGFPSQEKCRKGYNIPSIHRAQSVASITILCSRVMPASFTMRLRNPE